MALASAPGGAASGSEAARHLIERPALAPRGTPVIDGRFQFTVRGARQQEVVGQAPFESTPQGVYVVVDVDVTNAGPDPAMLHATDQRLLDAQGRAHHSVFWPGALAEADTALLSSIAPGASSRIPLLFDIPRDTGVDHVELRGSVLSAGVHVALR